jgi:hypothetical protein
MNSEKIILISHQLTISKNKERDSVTWNFVPHAVHALNPKKPAKATLSSYAAQNATTPSNPQIREQLQEQFSSLNLKHS